MRFVFLVLDEIDDFFIKQGKNEKPGKIYLTTKYELRALR